MGITVQALQDQADELDSLAPVLAPAVLVRGVGVGLHELMDAGPHESKVAVRKLLRRHCKQLQGCQLCGRPGRPELDLSADRNLKAATDGQHSFLWFTAIPRLLFKERVVAIKRGLFLCTLCSAVRDTKAILEGFARCGTAEDSGLDRLAEHAAAVNHVEASGGVRSGWLREAVNRAYALQVLASGVKGWRLAGPDGQPLDLSHPESLPKLVQQLLSAEQGGNQLVPQPVVAGLEHQSSQTLPPGAMATTGLANGTVGQKGSKMKGLSSKRAAEPDQAPTPVAAAPSENTAQVSAKKRRKGGAVLAEQPGTAEQGSAAETPSATALDELPAENGKKRRRLKPGEAPPISRLAVSSGPNNGTAEAALSGRPTEAAEPDDGTAGSIGDAHEEEHETSSVLAVKGHLGAASDAKSTAHMGSVTARKRAKKGRQEEAVSALQEEAGSDAGVGPSEAADEGLQVDQGTGGAGAGPEGRKKKNKRKKRDSSALESDGGVLKWDEEAAVLQRTGSVVDSSPLLRQEYPPVTAPGSSGGGVLDDGAAAPASSSAAAAADEDATASRGERRRALKQLAALHSKASSSGSGSGTRKSKARLMALMLKSSPELRTKLKQLARELAAGKVRKNGVAAATPQAAASGAASEDREGTPEPSAGAGSDGEGVRTPQGQQQGGELGTPGSVWTDERASSMSKRRVSWDEAQIAKVRIFHKNGPGSEGPRSAGGPRSRLARSTGGSWLARDNNPPPPAAGVQQEAGAEATPVNSIPRHKDTPRSSAPKGILKVRTSPATRLAPLELDLSPPPRIQRRTPMTLRSGLLSSQRLSASAGGGSSPLQALFTMPPAPGASRLAGKKLRRFKRR